MTSLHIKYRPKELSKVLGQTSVTNSLAKAIEKKTSHTFLLVGPSGVGKTTIARIAAQMVGCKRPDEINAAKYTGVDDMRAITDTLKYAPFDGNAKVVIIDECHQLSKQAWNSLLKDTEEPPEWMYWFFLTTEPGKVLPTIKTRCTTYNLKPVEQDKLMHLLDSIISKEKLKISQSIMKLCATEAQGSPRQAIVNLEVCMEAKHLDEAKELLQSAVDNPQAIDLARLLMKHGNWREVQKLLKDMKDINPESIRHVVRSYMTSVALNMNGKELERILEILDEFSAPFNSGDGITPVILACAHILLGE